MDTLYLRDIVQVFCNIINLRPIFIFGYRSLLSFGFIKFTWGIRGKQTEFKQTRVFIS